MNPNLLKFYEQELAHLRDVWNLDGFARERKVEAIEVDEHRQGDSRVLSYPESHEDRVEHLLAGLSMDLHEPGVTRRHDVIVVRSQRDRCR